MKRIESTHYLAHSAINLGDIPSLQTFDQSDKKLKKQLEKIREDLGEFQNILWAHRKYSVLICLQGMDTSGKDSLIREVFKDCNVNGVEVHSFKVPTDLERAHDYIWRHYIDLPPKGKFGVFNRTHYENVLVTRVHPEYILSENIPGVEEVSQINQAFWDARFEQINNFERHLAQNGTLIFKFYLHLSKEEQKQRLLRRLRLEQKHWKFSPGDLKERKLWDRYIACYEEAISRTTNSHAPWYVIPADNKRAARVIVASILLQELQKHKDIREPKLDEEIRANLKEYKRQLEEEN
ncbi:MAG: polyphosphate kinase 2 family protein [Eudoraea sp.]|nr:polyphosphate kinase 2 family protein [Eudoraea sp.]